MDSRLGNGPIETWSCWDFPNEIYLHNNHPGTVPTCQDLSHRTDSRGLGGWTRISEGIILEEF